jgi:hypothetical protein
MPTTLTVTHNRPTTAYNNELMPKLAILDYGAPKYGLTPTCWSLLVMSRRMVEETIVILDLYDISFVATMKDEAQLELLSKNKSDEGHDDAATIRAMRNRHRADRQQRQHPIDHKDNGGVTSAVLKALKGSTDSQDPVASVSVAVSQNNASAGSGLQATRRDHSKDVSSGNSGSVGSRRNSDSSYTKPGPAVNMDNLRSIFGDDNHDANKKAFSRGDSGSGGPGTPLVDNSLQKTGITGASKARLDVINPTSSKDAVFDIPGLRVDVHGIDRPAYDQYTFTADNDGDDLLAPIPAHSPRINRRK